MPHISTVTLTPHFSSFYSRLHTFGPRGPGVPGAPIIPCFVTSNKCKYTVNSAHITVLHTFNLIKWILHFMKDIFIRDK